MGSTAKNTAKKRRRRKRSVASYALPVVMLMTILLVILSYKLLRVKTITVEGTTRYQTGEIIAASGLELGSSMFKIKPSAINGAIERSLSYIGKAQLRFELPTTVVLSVEEAKVIASVYYNGAYVLVSDSYKVLQPDSPTPDVEVPVITGMKLQQPKAGEPLAGETEEDLTILKTLFDALAKYQMPKILSIDLENISNIKLLCENNNTILLGGPSELDYKLEFVSEIARQCENDGTFSGVVINAQAIDGGTSLSVSVLPAAPNSVPTQSETSSEEGPNEDNSTDNKEADNQNN